MTAGIPSNVAAAAHGPGVFFRTRHTCNFGLDDQPLHLERDALSLEIRMVLESEATKSVKAGETVCIATMWKPATTAAIKAWLNNPAEPPPSVFREFGLQALTELSEASDRAVCLIRWRAGQRRERRALRNFHAFHWSVDGSAWSVADAGLTFGVSAGPAEDDPTFTPELKDSITQLWNSEAQEPLAHELLQEAFSQQTENPRSSLVIAIAAAETSIKQLIATLVPHAAWLAENLPSPPLERMFREYLPLLPVKLLFERKFVLAPPKYWLDQLKKAVTLRNDIAHGRADEIKPKSLGEILLAINDLVYLLDIYAGHEWAWKRLSVEFQKVLADQAKSSPA